MNKIYTLWVLIVFSVFMIIFLPGIMIPFLLGNRFTWMGYKFLWLWSWIFSKLTAIQYELLHRDKIKKRKSYIYVSNHTSFLDIPGIRLIIPGEFRPIAKKELLKIPVFGFIVKAATVVVDRSNAESRKKSVEYARKILQMGISMLIFAEGTQNRTKELLQPFKDGAFRLAIDTQTPIMPLVVVGAGKLMPPGKLEIKPGKIKIVAGDEISVEGLTAENQASLKQKTFEVMKATLQQYHSSNRN
ncbi:MAG: 1-acyl-sn-glycerol-3-phosphate acyltransferase [Cyclobacteriaceae bacterium]|nr:1-acyl-sn-glycerol-3-phosphate acyltransferase [Cyclobacteriaceae bacterium]UYN86325.1 MAG: 1-acyl-sn-glycerol-3-phosphate acyltransferase [Cyclobacteriaceae bacterium]